MCSTVNPPLTFFQIERKRFFSHAVEPPPMAFGLVPEIFNAVNVIAMFHKRLGMINPQMMQTRDIQCVVTGQRIGVDNAVGHTHLSDNRQQGFGLGIGNGRGIDLSPPLQNTENGDFPRSSATAFSFPPSSEVTFIDFNFSRKGIVFGPFIGNHPPQAMVKLDRGVPVDANKLSRSPRVRACDKMFNQPIAFARTQPTFSLIYGDYPSAIPIA